MAMLYIFSGLPGAGKSTIAQSLSRSFNCAYVRVDTIEQSLRNLCGIEVYDEGYRLAQLIASDNLNQGVSVVADSCNPIALTRSDWEKAAIDNHANFINIEIICSDANEHKCRIENRNSTIDGLVLPSWNKVKNHEYQKWSKNRMAIDTAGSKPEESLGEIINSLAIAIGNAPNDRMQPVAEMPHR